MLDLAKRLALVVLIALAFEAQAFPELTVSQIAQKYSPSVVTIVALDKNDQPLSIGSGFFVSADGEIASNHHVLERSAKAIVKTAQGQKGEILEIIKDDPALDLLVVSTTLRDIRGSSGWLGKA